MYHHPDHAGAFEWTGFASEAVGTIPIIDERMADRGRVAVMAGKQKRSKSEHTLKPDHGWRCKPGYQIVVLNRGAVRFDIPKAWVVAPGAPFTIHDKPEPDDDCRIQVSVFQFPPGIDWSALPLDKLLADTMSGDDDPRNISRTEPVTIRRPGLEIAWLETLFLDPGENREACSRTCLARGSDVQPLITMDYWVDDATWTLPVWDELIRSLRLGQYVKDPTQGPPVYH